MDQLNYNGAGEDADYLEISDIQPETSEAYLEIVESQLNSDTEYLEPVNRQPDSSADYLEILDSQPATPTEALPESESTFQIIGTKTPDNGGCTKWVMVGLIVTSCLLLISLATNGFLVAMLVLSDTPCTCKFINILLLLLKVKQLLYSIGSLVLYPSTVILDSTH